MDFPLHFDTTRMTLLILYFKGSHVKVSRLWCFLSLKVVLILTNSEYPDKMQHCAAFHLGLHCLPKYSFRGFQYTKGYYM